MACQLLSIGSAGSYLITPKMDIQLAKALAVRWSTPLAGKLAVGGLLQGSTRQQESPLSMAGQPVNG